MRIKIKCEIALSSSKQSKDINTSALISSNGKILKHISISVWNKWIGQIKKWEQIYRKPDDLKWAGFAICSVSIGSILSFYTPVLLNQNRKNNTEEFQMQFLPLFSFTLVPSLKVAKSQVIITSFMDLMMIICGSLWRL